MAKLPILQPHAVTSVQTPLLPSPDALTPAQRQAYNDRTRKSPSTNVPGAQQMKPSTTSPSFVGGHPIPLLVKQFDGISSAQAGGGTGEAAIATDLSYVMEGVDNALAIYSASSGAKLYGPYSPDSFFAPVKHAGDIFAYPQMYYDVMRDRWIVVYLEIEPSHTVTYLDIAVSKTNSPTQPTPGGQYNVYQFDTSFEGTPKVNSYCDYETLGVDYWGLYISCVEYRNFSFVGNTVLAINKAPMLSGANPNTWFWNDALKIASDAGYGTESTNLSVCALTNLSNIAGVAPTFSCLHAALPYAYWDPRPARQLGGPNIAVGYGTKQVYYKVGRLFLAWTAVEETTPDEIFWAEIRLVLQDLVLANPQVLGDVDVTQESGIASPGDDLYMPSVVGTDEDDIVLVYNHSGPSLYPSIFYTGRKATDKFHTMGQTGSNAAVMFGTHPTTASWGKYGACAISLNSVTRGGVWCVGEYTGSVADPGWNTRLYNLRAE